MTYKELCDKISEIIPNASFDEDNHGQVIIYTNLRDASYDTHQLVEMTE